jgi:multidrug efflux system membrane fusion protein
MQRPTERPLLSVPGRCGRLAACALVVLAGAILTSGCGPASPAGKGAAKPVDVVVTTPVTDRVTDFQDFTGRLEATKTVDIRAHVSGYVNEVPFKEGDLVQADDLLFQIDPRPFQADYNQAAANQTQAQAELNLQQKNSQRMQKLRDTAAITQEEYDAVLAALERAQASVGAAVAARDRAKLYLDYTRVISPVAGRISRRFVDPGNLINADQTLLTTIVTENPMYAYFDIDERTYLDLVGPAPGDRGDWLVKQHYPLFVRLANEDDYIHPGTVDFVDNRLNGNTGTIRVRGVFENPRNLFRSGLFVRVRLPIGQAYETVLIPDEAILSDQGRKYVYVVNDRNAVEYRAVELGQAVGTLRVIKKGVAAGDKLIVNGMQRVKPKTEVHASVQAPPKAPSATGKQLTFDKPAAGGHQPAGS